MILTAVEFAFSPLKKGNVCKNDIFKSQLQVSMSLGIPAPQGCCQNLTLSPAGFLRNIFLSAGLSDVLIICKIKDFLHLLNESSTLPPQQQIFVSLFTLHTDFFLICVFFSLY